MAMSLGDNEYDDVFTRGAVARIRESTRFDYMNRHRRNNMSYSLNS